MDLQVHEMVLETTHSSGAQEWTCPTCGRRFLMQWPPAYKKIVLEPGDEQASHRGFTGDLFIDPLEVFQLEENSIPEESLRFWERALEELNLDDPEGDDA